MFQINRFLFGPVWCALVLAAAAQESPPPEIDRSKNPEAWMNSPSTRRPDAGRPMSPEMKAVNPIDVDHLKMEDLAKMSLDDPLLKYAYMEVFTRSMNNLRQMEAQQELALADMRRRGEPVSPMLLKLLEENQETVIEPLVLWNIEHLGTVRLEPYLAYARKLLRERPNSTVVAHASGLLARQGTKEDIELLEWLLEQQPFAITDATDALKVLRERLNPPQREIRPERRDKSSAAAEMTAGSADGAENHPQRESLKSSRKRPWIIGGIILAVLLGLYRLVRRVPRRPSS